MSFEPVKKVSWTLYTSTYAIRNTLPKVLKKHKLLSFDTETRSVYDKEARAEAKTYLKEGYVKDALYKQARVVAESSGLSYPSIVKTTHFVFGNSKDHSHVVVCDSAEKEMLVWKMLAEYEGLLLVHNSLFDLKIMYQRVGCLPKNYVDTALLVKCMINHVNIWKAKTGLKELMGGYYNPKWALMNDYEPESLKLDSFIEYAAIDGAACYYLYEIIQEELKEFIKVKVHQSDFPFERINEDYFFYAKDALKAGYKDSQIWSVAEGDDSIFTYGPSHHYINVIGYIVTEETHDGDTYYEESLD